MRESEMRNLSVSEMKAVSGGIETITVSGSSSGSGIGYNKWLFSLGDSYGGDFESEFGEIGQDGPFGDIPFPDLQEMLNKTQWREDHPGYSFNSADVTSVTTMDNGKMIWWMEDGSFWIDYNENGSPDTQLWNEPSGVYYDSNMDGLGDTLLFPNSMIVPG